MDPIQLIQMQRQGAQWGQGVMGEFAHNLRMKALMQRFAESGVRDQAGFMSFVKQNGLSPQEAMELAGMSKSVQSSLTPTNRYSSASGIGIYDQGTGQVVVPDTRGAGYGTAGSSIYDKATGKVVGQGYTGADYYRVNKDGSIESIKSRSQAEENMLEARGYTRGTYRAKPVGESSGGTIKTWILPSGRLWHAPSNQMPPSGSRPYSEAGELEKRMLVAGEVSALELEKRQTLREIDSRKKLLDLDIYKSQKAEIPELKSHIDDINYRLNELRNKGNDLNRPSSGPSPSDQDTPTSNQDQEGPDFSTLPDPSSVKPNTRMVWEPTGEVFVSDGVMWVSETQAKQRERIKAGK